MSRIDFLICCSTVARRIRIIFRLRSRGARARCTSIRWAFNYGDWLPFNSPVFPLLNRDEARDEFHEELGIPDPGVARDDRVVDHDIVVGIHLLRWAKFLQAVVSLQGHPLEIPVVCLALSKTLPLAHGMGHGLELLLAPEPQLMGLIVGIVPNCRPIELRLLGKTGV